MKLTLIYNCEGYFVMLLLQVVLGWLYGHFFEYAAHRWVFHNPKIKSAFRNHYSQHHARSKKGCMVDVTAFKKASWSDWEFRSLMILLMVHSPLLMIVPWFYMVLFYSAMSYYFVHRKAHRDHVWGRANLPWHYDHHMAPDSNKNWAVRLPIFDWFFGTRKVYKGTEKEIIRYRNYEKWGRYAVRPRSTERD